MISALIKTIGRPTLKNAVASAEREGITPIVVSDGYVGGNLEGAIVLPKNWGSYGSVAANVGVGFCETPHLMILDDDDELLEGAGDVIRSKIKDHPDVDIWIPGLQFNTGLQLCTGVDKRVRAGNVAVPICKIKVFTDFPFRSTVPLEDKNLIDFYQIYEAHNAGYKVDWICKNIYLIRPNLEGTNGRGE